MLKDSLTLEQQRSNIYLFLDKHLKNYVKKNFCLNF